ncbi:MAG: glycosyltransferase family 2 protein [Verrucomicrobia bacterium]|nr:glycosyltransferase family 2 protein [Verrucomicrobiota bacterium]
MPDISVIIPAYNRAGLIGAALLSLLNQTLPAKEIIVVDDGSTDGTAEKTLEAFENWKLETGNWKNDDCEQVSANSTSSIQHTTLKILSQANAGPGAARNRGLAEATGEFIHFFDSDDIVAPNKHEVQLRALLETGADIAYGPWVKGRFAPKEAQTVARPLAHGVARGSLPLAAQPARVAGATEATELSVASLNSENTRYQLPATLYSGFTPDGPVLQALGLPKGDLVRALLTTWSIVPHACLFRRSILEKAGGFPEDIWVGEDQLLFLRCLLAGARVVHSPGTMVYYRVGNDLGKLTAMGAAQKRHARDWARFLLKANKEVTSGEWRVTRVEEKNSTTIERQGGRENRKLGKAEGRATESWPQRGAASGSMQVKEQPKVGPKGDGVGTTESNHTNLHENGEKVSTTDNTDGHGCQKSQPGDAQGICAGASESDSLTSKLFDSPVSESLTRSASAPASLPATSYSLPFTHRPSAWFGFRLRAYEAWRDLGIFFPDGEAEVKNELQAIWKRNWFSGFRFQVSGFMLRKWGGLMNRIFGHRVKGGFRPGKFTSREKALFDAQ